MAKYNPLNIVLELSKEIKGDEKAQEYVQKPSEENSSKLQEVYKENDLLRGIGENERTKLIITAGVLSMQNNEAIRRQGVRFQEGLEARLEAGLINEDRCKTYGESFYNNSIYQRLLLTTQIQKLKASNKKLSEMIEDVKSKHTESEKQVEDYKTRIKKERKKSIEDTERTKTLENKIMDLEERLRAEQIVSKKSKSDSDHYEEKYENLQKQYRTSLEQIESLEEKNEHHKSESEEMKSKYETEHKKATSLKIELDETNAAFNNAKKEFKEEEGKYQTRISDLEEEVAEKTATIEHIQDELSVMGE